MSTDYRPRQGGGRRNRRHGRRGDRSQTRTSEPVKVTVFQRLFGWLFKKKNQSPAKSGGNRNAQNGARAVAPASAKAVDIKPEDITITKLYVGNLSYDAVESDIFDLFSQAGSVKNVEVVMDRQNNRSKGFGFVEMEHLDGAKAAVQKFNRTEFMGRQILVSAAKTDRR